MGRTYKDNKYHSQDGSKNKRREERRRTIQDEMDDVQDQMITEYIEAMSEENTNTEAA